jgi:hypothetical protein
VRDAADEVGADRQRDRIRLVAPWTRRIFTGLVVLVSGVVVGEQRRGRRLARTGVGPDRV